MHKNELRSLSKRILSSVAASALACSQMMTIMPFDAIAADEEQTEAVVFYGDVNGDKMVDSVDYSLIEKYARNGDDSNIDLKAADVDLDGKVTLRDGEIVLWHYRLLATGAKGLDLPYDGEVEWYTYPDPANYTVVNKGMTWEEAEAYCEEKGGHLAVITSEKEQIVIESLIR